MAEYVVEPHCSYIGCGCELKEEIVRCRDCKWYMHGESMWDTDDWCTRFDDAPIEPDGFCKWGKPREE